jgi:chromosome segregation protein
MEQKKKTIVVHRNELENEFINLKQDYALLEQKIISYDASNKNLKEQLTTATETIQLLKVQLENKQSSIDFEKRLEFMELENRNSSNTEMKLRQEITVLRDYYDKSLLSIKELERHKEESENKSKEIDVYYGVIKQLEKVLDDVSSNYTSLKTKLHLTENELEQANQIINKNDTMLKEYDLEIEKLQTSIVLLNKNIVEKDEYIYDEEDIYRAKLSENNYDISFILNNSSKVEFEKKIAELEALLKETAEEYKIEKNKADALSLQVIEDYKNIKKLQNGIEVETSPLNEHVKNTGSVLTRKKPLKNNIIHSNYHERTNRDVEYINSLLDIERHTVETETDLSASNIELLVEKEFNYSILKIQYDELKEICSNLQANINELSKYKEDVSVIIEQNSANNKKVLERYNVKIVDLKKIITENEKEIKNITINYEEHVNKYEKILKDFNNSDKKNKILLNEIEQKEKEINTLLKEINELNMLKDEIILLEEKNQDVTENYNSMVKANEQLSKDLKILKINFHDQENTLESLNSKMEKISSENETLIENENSNVLILKKQQNIIMELRNEKTEIENQFNEFKNKPIENQFSREEHNKIILKYKEELKNLVQENTNYGISENAYKESITQYKEEIEELNNTINKEKTEYDLMRDSLEELKQKETHYIVSLKKLENELENSKYETVMLKQKEDTLKEIMGDKDSIYSVKKLLDELKNENTILKQQLKEKENIEHEIEKKEDLLKNLNNLCEEKQNNIEKLENSLITANDNLNSMKERLEEIGSKSKSSNEQHNMLLNEFKNKLSKERNEAKLLENDLIEKETKLRAVQNELSQLQKLYDAKNMMLDKYQRNHKEIKDDDEALKTNIKDFKEKILTLTTELKKQNEIEEKLHNEIEMLENQKEELSLQLKKEKEKEKITENEDKVNVKETEEYKELEKKLSIQVSLLQKLCNSEKSLRENDSLMQDHIKSIMLEKEALRDDIVNLKELNNTIISRTKEHSKDKEDLEKSYDVLKHTIIEYAETIKKMSKNEYDHAYLRSQIHRQEKNFAAFI